MKGRREEKKPKKMEEGEISNPCILKGGGRGGRKRA